MKKIKVNNFFIGNNQPLTLIAGPCVLESKDHAFMMVEKIKEVASRNKINFIYKTSFDKANRTSINSSRGMGLDKALKIFEDIKKTYNCPILTDVHNDNQCAKIHHYQIPCTRKFRPMF